MKVYGKFKSVRSSAGRVDLEAGLAGSAPQSHVSDEDNPGANVFSIAAFPPRMPISLSVLFILISHDLCILPITVSEKKSPRTAETMSQCM